MAYDSSKPANGTSLVAADMRENFRALKEDDIVEGVAAGGIVEGMLGALAVTEAKLGAASVAQSKLKTSTHEQSTAATTWREKVLTYADYGFNCRVKVSAGVSLYFKRSDEANPTRPTTTSYVGESVWIKSVGGGGTVYVIYRYVTSSGEVFWVWLLRDKESGKITDADCCSDHCGWGLDDPNDRPHPFLNYDPEKHEILLFNPTPTELTEILAKKTKKRSVLQIVLEDYEPEEATKRSWPSIPVTFDIEDDNWEEKLFTGKEATIRQAVIKQVPYVKTVGMKRKAEIEAENVAEK